MKYLLTCTDSLGVERDIIKIEGLTDAINVWADLRIVRPLHRAMSLYELGKTGSVRVCHRDSLEAAQATIIEDTK